MPDSRAGISDSFVNLEHKDGISTLLLCRPPVNALTIEFIHQINHALDVVLDNNSHALVLTGNGPFFSFGFDVPHLLTQEPEQLRTFFHCFCQLYNRLFLLPCPTVAAINGHAIAGGCILVLTADVRIMVTGRTRISLNEIAIGASIFNGFVQILRFLVSGATASRMLYRGQMFEATAARDIGIIDDVTTPEELMDTARECAHTISRNRDAFVSMKRHLRKRVGQTARNADTTSVDDFLAIWQRPETQSQLQAVAIR